MLKSAVFPYVFPLQAGSGLFCALKQGFHAVRRIPFHALRCMGVNIQRERRRRVSKVFLHDLRAVARLQGIDSERMPLRYNYDKPEKPRISRVFGYLARFFILFRTEKSSREVVISQGVL